MASEASRDFFLVIALLVGLGIAWFYTGGPERSLSRSGPLLNQPAVGSGQAYSVPGVVLNRATSTRGSAGATGANSGSTWQTFTNYLGTFAEERSPYAAYVTLERGRADGSYADEYVIIRVAKNAPQKVTLSDWKIESTMSQIAVRIGNAAALPFSGAVNAEEPVAVNPGSVVYLATGRSPIGVGFRINACTGYFEQFQDFTPRLKLECPRPVDEAARAFPPGGYTDECEAYVRSISRCQITFAAIPGNVGGACYNFIQNGLTYNACVNAHKNEPGFYKDEWRLFLKRDQELWRDRAERIRLLDEKNKVVGVVSY